MNQHVRYENVDFEINLTNSENYSLSMGKRSKFRHALFDVLAQFDDDEKWREAGNMIVRAWENDDLSAQVSDRFVDESPDHIFQEFMNAPPVKKFRGWQKRRVCLLQKKGSG